MARVHYSGPIQSTAGFESADGDFLNSKEIVNFNVAGGAAVADFDGQGWIADKAYQLVSATERHAVASSVATAEIMIRKAASGTAKASGTAMLAGDGFETNATADTNVAATLHATLANIQVASGDLVAPVLDEAATSLDGVTITLVFKALAK